MRPTAGNLRVGHNTPLASVLDVSSCQLTTGSRLFRRFLLQKATEFDLLHRPAHGCRSFLYSRVHSPLQEGLRAPPTLYASAAATKNAPSPTSSSTALSSRERVTMPIPFPSHSLQPLQHHRRDPAAVPIPGTCPRLAQTLMQPLAARRPSSRSPFRRVVLGR